MSEIHLSDLSKIYKEQIVEKKDDTYLEPDMKKRQKNNEKARKDMEKMGTSMKNPHFESLDPVGQEDGDIDNDGDKDKTDKYLMNRRKAISKAIKGKMKKEEYIPEVMTDSMDDKPIKEKKVKNVVKINPKLGESVEEIGGELIEAVEIVDILEEITDQELRFISDKMIDEIVEEFFAEAVERDEDLEVLQQNLCESIDLSISLLLEQDAGAEARKRMMNRPARASVMDRVKSAVKKGAKVARKAVVKGSEVAGKVVGDAKNLAKDMGSAAKKGYQSTQSGSSDSSSSSDSKKKGPGLLSRIGAKLKRGIGKAARAVSRGSRNLARKMDEAVYGGTPPEKKDTRMVVTNADKKANTLAYQKMKAGDKRYKSADHMNEGDGDPCWDSHKQVGMKKKGGKMVPNCVPKNEEVEVDEAMSSYDKNRKRAAQRAADRNAARAAGKTGVVPGVGYVTARKEKETYTDEKGTVRHKSGARNEEVETEVEEGYQELSRGKRNTMFRKAGNLSRTALQGGDKGTEAGKKSGKIVKALNKDAEKYNRNDVKEDASMTPQEIALQKKKAMLDRMIAQKRQQGLNKANKSEAPAKAMGEETEDSLKDRRMERGGVDGNNRYKSAPKNVAMGGGKKKPYDGMSALEKVKASIRAKHGQGAIMDTKKK